MGQGNSPKTAVWAYLEALKREPAQGVDGEDLHFEIDLALETSCRSPWRRTAT